jgi:SAM-dependent methyltransferase
VRDKVMLLQVHALVTHLTLMTTQPTLDRKKLGAFLGKVLADTSGMMVTIMAHLGDHLGLFQQLAQGPATSTQLAARAHISERYAREWLYLMASAGYVTYDPASHSFTLPPEHIPVLAQEGSPLFYGGVHQVVMGAMKSIDQLVQAFQNGGGIAPTTYDDSVWQGMERLTRGQFEQLLIHSWLPALPQVQERLEQGCRLADVGCGHGRALIKLAQTYPASRYAGYDLFEPLITRAEANAQAEGVADRVQFWHLDVSEGLPELYDIITTFDVVHDAVSPRQLLQAIRQALRPDGRYLCLEINSSDKAEENVGPRSSFLYGLSLLYCLPTSLHGQGEGLGTLGLPESKLRELCLEVGFSKVRRVPLDLPFNILYEITA